MECLGTLLRVVGDRPLNSYLENIDKTKMTKVLMQLISAAFEHSVLRVQEIYSLYGPLTVM